MSSIIRLPSVAAIAIADAAQEPIPLCAIGSRARLGSSLSLGSCSLGGDGRVIEAISWPSKSSEFSDEPRGKKESYFKLNSALFSISFLGRCSNSKFTCQRA